MNNGKNNFQIEIENLNYFMQNLNEINLEEFNNFKESIIDNLEGGLKIRFINLKFYEVLGDDEFDEIPF